MRHFSLAAITAITTAALGACGVVDDPGVADADPGADTSTDIDTTPACDPTPAVLRGVTARTTMGTAANTRIAALVDRSGLSATDTHGCTLDDGWIAATGVQGTVTLDLGAVYDVTQVRVWNHGGNAGTRGARDVVFQRSIDNKSLFRLGGAPTALARTTTCAIAPQTFAVPGERARFVIVEISSSHGQATVGLSEVEVTGARVCE